MKVGPDPTGKGLYLENERGFFKLRSLKGKNCLYTKNDRNCELNRNNILWAIDCILGQQSWIHNPYLLLGILCLLQTNSSGQSSIILGYRRLSVKFLPENLQLTIVTHPRLSREYAEGFQLSRIIVIWRMSLSLGHRPPLSKRARHWTGLAKVMIVKAKPCLSSPK